MIDRRRLMHRGLMLWGLQAGLGASSAAQAQAPTQSRSAGLSVLLLTPGTDGRLERSRLERALPWQASGDLADAVALGLKDLERPLQQAGVRVDLVVERVEDGPRAAERVAALTSAAASTGRRPFLVLSDLPGAWLSSVVKASAVPVINVSEPGDAWRHGQCAPTLWHTVPSERMRADALAQALVARRWTKVLLLVPKEGEADRIDTVQGALQRYGLKRVESRAWRLSADPRERDLAHPALLTRGDYDAVWVIDGDGEFGQQLPYRTQLPRPVVGDAGLMAVAWSPRFDRFGAPQVSRRLLRQAGRPLGSVDWGGWIAGRIAASVATGLGMAGSIDAARVQQALRELEVDGSKGVALSFRPWDGQLRQPMLLTDGQAVVDLVPGEGVLHPRNRLDTLGTDAPEQRCPRSRT